jgi:hypothetical protein
VTRAANDPRAGDVLGEVTHWFFDDYLSRYISVVNGTRQEGPEFILDYWGCPVHVSSPRMNQWLSEPRDVAGMLAGTQARLRAAGYTHTAVVAGHKDPSACDGPEIVAETRGYIRDFEAGIAATSTALELYRYMRERQARRINSGALWGSARAAKQ